MKSTFRCFLAVLVSLFALWSCAKVHDSNQVLSTSTHSGSSNAKQHTGNSTSRPPAQQGDARIPESSGSGAQQPSSAGTAASGQSGAGAKLHVPCVAPLPTGFCVVGRPGFRGPDATYSGTSIGISSNPASPGLSPEASTSVVEFLGATDSRGDSWSFDFVAAPGSVLEPGLYDPAGPRGQGSDMAKSARPGLEIVGFENPADGVSPGDVGCFYADSIAGRFAIAELEIVPTIGVTRFSATFEQSCGGSVPNALGMVNYHATGDPPLTSSMTIALQGNVTRIVYDASENVAYGLDAANLTIARIDLTTASVTYSPVSQAPNDGCVDHERTRLFVVNQRSSTLSEYALGDLTWIRDIPWQGMDWQAMHAPGNTQFHIYCAPDKLYVVDGAVSPGLFSVEGLDSAAPSVVDHSALLSDVGGLVLNTASTDLYYWDRHAWCMFEYADTSVRRIATSDLSTQDQTLLMPRHSFECLPLDAPILLDETRGLIFAKNRIFEAANLANVVFTLPGRVDSIVGAEENVFALDATGGLVATRSSVYELNNYQSVAPTLTETADQMFFDRDGRLWFLRTTAGALEAQMIAR